MNRIKLAAIVAALSLLGCPNEAAPEAVPPVANVPRPAPVVKPPNCNSDFADPLTVDTTLRQVCSPYSVKRELSVVGFTLTIEPGVTIEFADGTSMTVGYSGPGKVLVKGTKEKPVKFTGKAWKGLSLKEGAAGSSFSHLAIENAGGDDPLSDAAFKSETHEVSLTSVTFTGARKTVLALRVDQPLTAFSDVDLSRSSEDPSQLIHARIATAGVFGPDSRFPPRAVIWLDHQLTSDVTLRNVGATYRITESSMHVDAAEGGKGASLTIKEGVTVELAEGTRLVFGYYRGPAGLKIEGTREKPVTITRAGGADSPPGLQFLAGALPPEIDFLVMDNASLLHTDSQGVGKITHSTFRHLKAGAIRIDSSKERFTAFDNNTFEDVEGAALRLPLELAHGLGANNKFTDKARVTLFGDAKRDTTLENIGAPYLVEGELAVNGAGANPATLTIAPGNTLLFNDQGKLSVSYMAPAKLVAKGTVEKPIVFGKLLTAWGGVGIYGKGSIDVENAKLSGTRDEVWPLDLGSDVTGSVKQLALSETRKGIHGCAKKVKPEGATADKGIKPVEKCR